MRYPMDGAIVIFVILLAATCAAAAADGWRADGWRADAELVRRMSENRPEIVYDEAQVPAYELPNPLKRSTGELVTSPQQWGQRREEIVELVRSQMFGRRPPTPEQLRFEVLEAKSDALDGAATLKRISIHSRQGERSHQFELTLFLPNAIKQPVPVFVLINNRPAENADPTRRKKSPFWPVEAMIARGYGIAAFAYGELAPDNRDRFRDGVIRLFEGEATTQPSTRHPGDACGALAAWGWGASRVMDYLESDPGVDGKKVAIVGHSRGGKAALWTGAEDERFALVISNGSGCGGAALSRRRLGETVAIINRNFPHWFCDNFKRFNDRENALPFDQHMLISLIAPRAVYVASGSEDLWADPRGEFLSLAGASGVYALWGHAPINPGDMPPLGKSLIAPLRGYHVHDGPHNLTEFDWMRFADFADGLWPR